MESYEFQIRVLMTPISQKDFSDSLFISEKKIICIQRHPEYFFFNFKWVNVLMEH